MRITKDAKPISRVKCVVDTCEYWETGDHCLASEIEIQPPNAADTEETDCATFSPKNY
ncbi:MAG TPA: DUF1540 domain-containing protein [Firmicutes bacterium]|nr:DUF1540 domain-containing protein [Bacillota bacterium]